MLKRLVNRKKFLSLGIFVFAILLLSAFASATLSGVSLVSPASNENISGTYTFNATITGTAATNVTFYWWNSTGSSWKLLCFNSTGNAGPFTCSYDTAALPDGTLNTFNATAVNGTSTARRTDNNTGITIDNTVPAISISSPSAGWKRQNITIYANATDATTNVTNSTMYFWFGNSTGNFSKTLFTSCGYVSSATGFNCSQSFNTTNLADGNYTLWINASDTLGNVENQSLTLVGVDNSAPTASFSCSPTGDLYADTNVTCTCLPSDSYSGVNSSLTSYPHYPSTSSIGTFSLTCTFGDNIGNTGSTTTSYRIVYAATSSSPGTGGSATTTTTSQNAFASITAGTPAVVSGFSSNVGLKQVTINVNNDTSNVQFTVVAYSDKPSDVQVAAPGTIFQYFHVDTLNLENVLSNATMEIRVNRSWVSDNSANYSEISLFKFDNSSSSWNDLNAIYSSQDDNYYYYNATVSSFSYFAISEKALAAQNESQQTGTSAIPSNFAGSTWFWIIVSVVGLIIIGVMAWIVIRARH